MFTADERRAIVFLAAVAAVGGAVRVLRHPAAPPVAPAAVAPELRGGDVQRQAALARRAAEQALPLRDGEVIDLDVASAADVARLPGVGPSLARRIVSDRQSNGPFGGFDALDQVPGIGPAMLARIRPHVRFSGVPRAAPQIATGKAVVRARRTARRVP